MSEVRTALVAFVCGVLLGAAAGCTSDSNFRVIRLGHGLDATHPVHRALEYTADVLEEGSDGRMRLVLYPSEQLGSERECLELLQIGSLGMTKVSASVLENFAPSFAVFTVPYLFRDDAHRFAVLDGEVGRRLLESTEPYRLRGVGYFDSGSRSFYTRDGLVRTPADLVGRKIRTQESPSAIAAVAALGGAATPISWGELYTALQQGVVDGAENNPPSYHLSGHHEVAPFYSLDEHTAVPDVLLMSTGLWADLSEDERGWLTDAFAAGVERQRVLWREATDEALAAVVAGGATVHRPDKKAFAAHTEPLRDRYRADPLLGPLVREIEGVSS